MLILSVSAKKKSEQTKFPEVFYGMVALACGDRRDCVPDR
jgi:hypothetical protein